MSVKHIEVNGLPAVRVENPLAAAVITLHGAHVMSYTPAGMDELLFVSKSSEFRSGCPIRGGVPVCFPWFGAAPAGRSGSHGTVRNVAWELLSADDETVVMTTQTDEFHLRYTVKAAAKLEMTLEITNISGSQAHYSGALHTYFQVGEVTQITFDGVADTGYYDSLIKMDMVQNDALKIDREIDRVYKSTGEIIITDPVMKRRIEIAKSGSRSTVIWNPWIDKAKRMPDFGDDEYPQMVCVEAANGPAVGDARTLAPGEKAVLSQSIRAVKL